MPIQRSIEKFELKAYEENEKLFNKSYKQTKTDGLSHGRKINPLNYAWDSLKVKFNRFLYERKTGESISNKVVTELNSSLDKLLKETAKDEILPLNKYDLDVDIGILRKALDQTKQIIERLNESKVDKNQIKTLSDKQEGLKEKLNIFVEKRKLQSPFKNSSSKAQKFFANPKVEESFPLVRSALHPKVFSIGSVAQKNAANLFPALEERENHTLERFEKQKANFSSNFKLDMRPFFKDMVAKAIESTLHIDLQNSENPEIAEDIKDLKELKGLLETGASTDLNRAEFETGVFDLIKRVLPNIDFQGSYEKLIHAKLKSQKRLTGLEDLFRIIEKTLDKELNPAKKEALLQFIDKLGKDLEVITQDDVNTKKNHFLKGLDPVPIDIWNQQAKSLIKESYTELAKILSGDHFNDHKKKLQKM